MTLKDTKGKDHIMKCRGFNHEIHEEHQEMLEDLRRFDAMNNMLRKKNIFSDSFELNSYDRD